MCCPFVLKRFWCWVGAEVVSVKRHQELHVTHCQLQTALGQSCHCPRLSSSVTVQNLMAEQVEMPGRKLKPAERPCWSWSPWRELCVGADFQAGPVTHGSPEAVPEGLHPVEKDSHWSSSLRTPSCRKDPQRVKKSCQEWYPVGGTPCGSKGTVWERKTGIHKVFWTDHNHNYWFLWYAKGRREKTNQWIWVCKELEVWEKCF